MLERALDEGRRKLRPAGLYFLSSLIKCKMMLGFRSEHVILVYQRGFVKVLN